jgi:glycosyltransferase involved in cell wall biosynthesis
MPVLDEARYLAESVRRILHQDYPAELGRDDPDR